MKVAVDIPKETLEKIQNIINTEDYENPTEFVNSAIETQIRNEMKNKSDNIPTIEEYLRENLDPNLNTNTEIKSPLQKNNYSNIDTCKPPKSEYLENGPLWGQYNRLFPTKIIVRFLANSLNRSKYNNLKSFYEDVSEIAREIGFQVKNVDEELNRKRGEKLSSALPIGNDAEKSKNRFKDQFVGKLDRNEKLTGACPTLRFVNITSKEQIGITDAGLKFAKINNPLIDDSINRDIALSENEREFILSHLSEVLPNEFEALISIVKSIEKGRDRPNSLNQDIASFNGNWSKNQADTIRTGLVSRMYELGLVTRERVGQRGIAYRLTEDGLDFSSRVGIKK